MINESPSLNDDLIIWNNDTLHEAIKSSFKNYTSKHLIHSTNQIIDLLFYLPSTDSFKFLKIIDLTYPGLSFHFLMECVNFVYETDVLFHQKLLFTFRISYYLVCFPEKEMLQPMRTRLCRGLLFQDIEPKFFTDFQQKMHDVDKREFISKEDRKKIKKDLYLAHFKEYIHTLTLEYEQCYK